jgi:hypothetical protein
VIKEGFGLGPHQRVYVQTVSNEIVEARRPFMGFFELLYGFIFELPHGNEWFEVGVRYYTLRQLYSGDS